MLIDDLINSLEIQNVSADWKPFRERLLQAEKFELAIDFAAAAEELAMNYDVIAGAIPFCRLPYPIMWIEVAQANRPRYSHAPVHIPQIQGIPHRVGFLLTSQSNDLSSFKAHQFWNMKDELPFASHMAMSFDPRRAKEVIEVGATLGPDASETKYFNIGSAPQWKAASPSVRAQLNAIVRPEQTDYLSMLQLVHGQLGADTEFGQYLAEVGAADWSGESVFLLATLALINTVNAVERREVSLAYKNKKRRNSQHPLADYHVLTISPRLKKRIPKGEHPVGGYKELRAHMVMGHWKVRKTGIFFWRPFMRGDRQKGMVGKSYKVK